MTFKPGPRPSGAHGGLGMGWPVQTVLPAEHRAFYTIVRANAQGKNLLKYKKYNTFFHISLILINILYIIYHMTK